jgi:hypothetical protein
VTIKHAPCFEESHPLGGGPKRIGPPRLMGLALVVCIEFDFFFFRESWGFGFRVGGNGWLVDFVVESWDVSCCLIEELTVQQIHEFE